MALDIEDCTNINPSSLPWIYFSKQPSFDNSGSIILRRGVQVLLTLDMERFKECLIDPRFEDIDSCCAIMIPATPSVKSCGGTVLEPRLWLGIRVLGGKNGTHLKDVCSDCAKREGKRKGTPGIIDFHSNEDILQPKSGHVKIAFTFCCYPKHHDLSAYR